MEKKTENEMDTGVIRGSPQGLTFLKGLYRDNGKENGNFYLRFRVLALGLSSGFRAWG